MFGKLYLVATPIGNIEDISIRAISTLKNVDLVLCEDTRTSGILLSHYGIKKQLLSYHAHNEDERIPQIVEFLMKGKSVALISDSGTPCISDPGSKLVRACIEREIQVVPLPGPNAIIPSLVLSGFKIKDFYFEGFIPQKKGRLKKLEEIAKRKSITIFYESPYRIIKLLGELNHICPDRNIVLCRELTKKFEEVIRGTVKEIYQNRHNLKLKGEFTVVIGSE